jgi:hypothetical protein
MSIRPRSWQFTSTEGDMLKTSAGEIVCNVPRIPVRGSQIELDGLTVDDAARIAGLSRTFLYQSMNLDASYREGLPFLPSIKVGKARRIRLGTLRQWLASLEQAQQPEA